MIIRTLIIARENFYQNLIIQIFKNDQYSKLQNYRISRI